MRKKASVKIKIATPVFICSGETIPTTECFFYSENGKSRFVNFDLIRFVNENPGRGSQIVSKLLADPVGFDLGTELSDSEKTNEGYIKYAIQKHGNYKSAEPEVRSHVKSPLTNGVYIPGSSLKGAIRTAVLADVILQKRVRIKANVSEKWLMKLLRGAENQPQYDFFRFVEVGDSDEKSPDESLGIYFVDVLSGSVSDGVAAQTKSEVRFKGYNVMYEGLNPGTVFKTAIKFNAGVFSGVKDALGFSGNLEIYLEPSGIVSAINRFSLRVIEKELEFLRGFSSDVGLDYVSKFYESVKKQIEASAGNVAYLCLGQGAGWLNTTIGSLIIDAVRGKEWKEFRLRNKLATHRMEFVFPKSRKMVRISKNNILPPGWIGLEFI